MKVCITFPFILCYILMIQSCGFLSNSWDPFTGENEIGVILSEGEEITISNSEFGDLTVKYLGPSKRLISFKGEDRILELSKSKSLNGIYAEGKQFKQPIGNIRGFNYIENTTTYSDVSLYESDIEFHNKIGFKNCMNDINVYCRITIEKVKEFEHLYISIQRVILEKNEE